MRNTTYVMPLTGKQQLPASIRSRELLLCALLYQVAKDVSGDLTGGGGSGVLDDLLAGAGLALCACELVAYDGCKSCGQGGDDGLPAVVHRHIAFLVSAFPPPLSLSVQGEFQRQIPFRESCRICLKGGKI